MATTLNEVENRLDERLGVLYELVPIAQKIADLIVADSANKTRTNKGEIEGKITATDIGFIGEIVVGYRFVRREDDMTSSWADDSILPQSKVVNDKIFCPKLGTCASPEYNVHIFISCTYVKSKLIAIVRHELKHVWDEYIRQKKGSKYDITKTKTYAVHSVNDKNTVQRLFYLTGETREIESYTQEAHEYMLNNNGDYINSALYREYQWMVDLEKELLKKKENEKYPGEFKAHMDFILGFYPSSWTRNKAEKDFWKRLSKGIKKYARNIDRLRREYEESKGKESKNEGEDIVETTVKQLLKQAEKDTDKTPTPAQAKAGNYKKGRVTIHGLDIAIENPKGSYRKGIDDTGKEWKVKMNNTYGYFEKTKAIDGDAVDVFIGDNLESNKVFCIDQYISKDGVNCFDETKVMFGFDGEKEAREAYLSNYEKGWGGLGDIIELDIDTFKIWLDNRKNKKQRKPVAYYKSFGRKKELVENMFHHDSNFIQRLTEDELNFITDNFQDPFVISEIKSWESKKHKTIKESIEKKELVKINEIKLLKTKEETNEILRNKRMKNEGFYLIQPGTMPTSNPSLKTYRIFQRLLYEGIMSSYPIDKTISIIEKSGLTTDIRKVKFNQIFSDKWTNMVGFISFNLINDNIDEINKLLDVCGYFISEKKKISDNEFSIFCEPKYNVEVTQLVYNKNSNIETLYHVTKKEVFLNRILKNGLCPKTSSKSYGNTPERIYLTTNKENAIELFTDKNENMGEVGDYVVLSIETDKKSGYRYYLDPRTPNSLYTLDNIAPQYINVISEFTIDENTIYNIEDMVKESLVYWYVDNAAPGVEEYELGMESNDIVESDENETDENKIVNSMFDHHLINENISKDTEIVSEIVAQKILDTNELTGQIILKYDDIKNEIQLPIPINNTIIKFSIIDCESVSELKKENLSNSFRCWVDYSNRMYDSINRGVENIEINLHLGFLNGKPTSQYFYNNIYHEIDHVFNNFEIALCKGSESFKKTEKWKKRFPDNEYDENNHFDNVLKYIFYCTDYSEQMAHSAGYYGAQKHKDETIDKSQFYGIISNLEESITDIEAWEDNDIFDYIREKYKWNNLSNNSIKKILIKYCKKSIKKIKEKLRQTHFESKHRIYELQNIEILKNLVKPSINTGIDFQIIRNHETHKKNLWEQNMKTILGDNCFNKHVENIVNDVLYENGLLSEATATEIHQKYYPNISEEDFNNIVNTDKISSNLEKNKLGMYGKWLLNLYKNNSLKLEDLYKAEEYLPIFDKLSKQNRIENKDINTYKSLADLYSRVIKPVESENLMSKKEANTSIKGIDPGEFQEGVDYEIVYDDGDWNVISPKTMYAAIWFGKGTEWCTADPKPKNNAFDDHNQLGPLYILNNKSNNRKYQFHKQTKQFKDEEDLDVEISDLTDLIVHEKLPGQVLNLYAEKEPDDYGNFLIIKSRYEKVFFVYSNGELTGCFHNDNTYYISDKWGLYNNNEQIFYQAYNKLNKYWVVINAITLDTYPKLGGYDGARFKIIERVGEDLWSYEGKDIHHYGGIVRSNGEVVLDEECSHIFYTDGKIDDIPFSINLSCKGIYVSLTYGGIYYFNEETYELQEVCSSSGRVIDNEEYYDDEIEDLDEYVEKSVFNLLNEDENPLIYNSGPENDVMDPEDKIEEPQEFKIKRMIGVINTKVMRPAERYNVLLYILGDKNVDLSFIKDESYRRDVEDACQIISSRLTSTRSMFAIYDYIFNEVNQSNMSNSQYLNLRNRIKRLKKLTADQRNTLRNTVMEAVENIVSDENFKEIIISDDAPRIIRDMSETGELYSIIPELKEQLMMHNSPYHSPTNILEHTLRVFSETCATTNDYCSRMAALLHDIGKPFSYQEKPDGTYSYIGHDKVGENKAEEILRRLGNTEEEIETILWIIANHMRANSMMDTKKEYKKREFAGHKHMDRGLPVFNADSKGEFGKWFDDLKKKYGEFLPKPEITEEDLIAKGHVQGTKLQELLRQKYIAQLNRTPEPNIIESTVIEILNNIHRPILFKDGEKQKKDFDEHLSELLSDNTLDENNHYNEFLLILENDIHEKQGVSDGYYKYPDFYNWLFVVLQKQLNKKISENKGVKCFNKTRNANMIRYEFKLILPREMVENKLGWVIDFHVKCSCDCYDKNVNKKDRPAVFRSHNNIINNKLEYILLELNLEAYDNIIDETLYRSEISHEINHAWEHYQSLLKTGDSSIEKQRKKFYGVNISDDDINFLITYLFIPTEMNAMIASIYGELEGMKSTNRPDIFNTFVFKNLEKIKNTIENIKNMDDSELFSHIEKMPPQLKKYKNGKSLKYALVRDSDILYKKLEIGLNRTAKMYYDERNL